MTFYFLSVKFLADHAKGRFASGEKGGEDETDLFEPGRRHDLPARRQNLSRGVASPDLLGDSPPLRGSGSRRPDLGGDVLGELRGLRTAPHRSVQREHHGPAARPCEERRGFAREEEAMEPISLNETGEMLIFPEGSDLTDESPLPDDGVLGRHEWAGCTGAIHSYTVATGWAVRCDGCGWHDDDVPKEVKTCGDLRRFFVEERAKKRAEK